MIALTLRFTKESPFFAQEITVVGEDISAIESTIDRQFCSSTTLQLFQQEGSVFGA